MKQMKEVYDFLDRYNRTHSEVMGIMRKDTREYPEVAIREALLNAIVHKDYSFSGSTLISIFDDRIEFVTIGGLVRGINEDDILLGVSISRNKNLARIFYQLKWIEAYGTGILKTIESYERFKLKPIIEISSNAFKITLPNTTISRRKKNDITSLSEKEKVIISMFDKTETISRTDVEKELSISQTMAVKLLKQLLDKSIISRFEIGRASCRERV